MVDSITAFGEASARGLVPRSGAVAGDLLYVSGTLGGPALGLQLRLKGEAFAGHLAPAGRDFLLGRYLYPEPRLALAPVLASLASAAMDISDGLALDLSRMCAASGVTARIDVPAIPLPEAVAAIAAKDSDALKTALTGGDDYEILAAVAPEYAAAFEAAGREAGVPVTRIGAVIAGKGAPKFFLADGQELRLPVQGYEHFKP